MGITNLTNMQCKYFADNWTTHICYVRCVTNSVFSVLFSNFSVLFSTAVITRVISNKPQFVFTKIIFQ